MRKRLCAALLVAAAAVPGCAAAGSDPLQDMLPVGGAGIGLTLREESSPYRGDRARNDFVPLYLYEG
ncbi:MAG TPA: MipA/OmpV family protein, partial [Burkholderiales bacterium]|nr:MipA/OmpV family protein [Burkholderiales bacterium]